MWLRDSTGQVKPLLALAGLVPEVVDLVRGVLRAQVEQVLIDPRANAFNPGPTGEAMRRDFRDQSSWVFERKYATDSLCAPLTLAWHLHRTTGRDDHVDRPFLEAARTIVALWRREQHHEPGSYRLRRRLARRRDSLRRRGRGTPVAWTGMTWSGYRPSDDACVRGYHVPANALAAVSLQRLAALLDPARDAALAADARTLAAEITAGIREHGVVAIPGREPIYAYEVDGLGHALLLDDANIPSLLTLPYVGFCERSDPVYAATRSWLLGPANPNWASGRVVHGVGSGHTPRGWVWPLAVIAEGLTASNDEERESALRRAEATLTAGGLFRESVHPSRPLRFTRRWFSWADMLYVELVLASAGVA
jgi:meiotically up-regulated gene 157 (Mug157) protein